MKVLAFADLHEHMASVSKLRKKKEKADIILCAGDMSIFENNLPKIMKKIASLKKQVYVIHGNHETASHVKAECDKYENLHFCHKRVFKLDNLTILGYGGGGFNYDSKDFEDFFKKNKNHLQQKNILLTHQPPTANKVDVVIDEHVGNKSFRKYLKHFDLSVFGHLHDTFGQKEKIGKTLLVNPGPDGMVLEV